MLQSNLFCTQLVGSDLSAKHIYRHDPGKSCIKLTDANKTTYLPHNLFPSTRLGLIPHILVHHAYQLFLLLLWYEVLPQEDTRKGKGCSCGIFANGKLRLRIVEEMMHKLQTKIFFKKMLGLLYINKTLHFWYFHFWWWHLQSRKCNIKHTRIQTYTNKYPF